MALDEPIDVTRAAVMRSGPGCDLGHIMIADLLGRLPGMLAKMGHGQDRKPSDEPSCWFSPVCDLRSVPRESLPRLDGFMGMCV